MRKELTAFVLQQEGGGGGRDRSKEALPALEGLSGKPMRSQCPHLALCKLSLRELCQVEVNTGVTLLLREIVVLWSQGLAPMLLALPILLNSQKWKEKNLFRCYNQGKAWFMGSGKCIMAASSALTWTDPLPHLNEIRPLQVYTLCISLNCGGPCSWLCDVQCGCKPRVVVSNRTLAVHSLDGLAGPMTLP